MSTLPRILCVDDEPNVLEALRRQLRRQFDLTTATSGDEALAILSQELPFAAIVSDMRMPRMDGATLLSTCRQRYPESTRLLLTGYSDLDSAVRAVNEGRLFRFLVKPCATPDLVAAIEDAVEQHRLVLAERELLDLTLRGSVRALVEILALSNPEVFGSSDSIADVFHRLMKLAGEPVTWDSDVAVRLSQLGAIMVPPDLLRRARTGHLLRPEERSMLEDIPQSVDHLLAQIPRLESVRHLVRCHHLRFDGQGSPPGAPVKKDIPIAARCLKIAAAFVESERRHGSPAQVVARLKSERGVFDPELLELLQRESRDNGAPKIRKIALHALAPGMRFAEDVRTSSGVLLVAKDCLVTPVVLQRLYNLNSRAGNLPALFYVHPEEPPGSSRSASG